MTRQEALGRLLELRDYFCRRFADAPMESEEEAEAYKHARAVNEAILLLSQEETDAEALSVAAATGSRQESRFSQYVKIIREVKDMIKQRETAGK